MKTQEVKKAKKAKAVNSPSSASGEIDPKLRLKIEKDPGFIELNGIADEFMKAVDDYWNWNIGGPAEIDSLNWDMLKTTLSSPDFGTSPEYASDLLHNYELTRDFLRVSHKFFEAKKAVHKSISNR